MEKIKKFLTGFYFNLFINVLVILSIVLLLLTKLFKLDRSVVMVLDKIDLVVLAVFSAEFVVKLVLFGKRYFLKEFGWIDLLACIPVLTPVIGAFTQIKSLRMARMIRFIRIIRVMRLFKSANAETERHSKVRTNFFLGVSSITMLFILAMAISITLFIERFADSQRELEMQFLINSLNGANLNEVVKHDLILGITVVNDGASRHFGTSASDIENNLLADDYFVFAGEKDKALFPDVSDSYIIYFSNVDKKNLMNLVELVIMVTAVLSAFAIILTSMNYLSGFIMNRIKTIYRHIFDVVDRGQKLPMIVDNMDDEITELTRAVNRMTDIYII